MTKNEENNTSGELWLRIPSGKLVPSQDALSAINIKYKIINNDFYNNLKNNEIKKFDCFYDVIYLQTNTGYIFEKIDQNKHILSDENHLTLTYDGRKYPDYWLDEPNKKIYIASNKIVSWTNKTIKINVTIQQFDIHNNIFLKKLSYDTNLEICPTSISYTSIPSMDAIKMSYNADTKCFNISYILRSPTGEFGLINNIIKKDNILNVDKVYCLLPYCNLKTINVDVFYNKMLETDFFN